MTISLLILCDMYLICRRIVQQNSLVHLFQVVEVYGFDWTAHVWMRIRVVSNGDCLWWLAMHYYDVIMSAMASQITSLMIVYSIVYSGADQRKLCVAGFCAGNSPVTSEFPAQIASNTENLSIWWRHLGGLWFHWTAHVWRRIRIVSNGGCLWWVAILGSMMSH